MNPNDDLQSPLRTHARKLALIAAVAVVGVFLYSMAPDSNDQDPKTAAKRADRAVSDTELTYAAGNVAAAREALKEAVRLEATGDVAAADAAFRRAVEQFNLASEIANASDSRRSLDFSGDTALGEIYTRASVEAGWRKAGPAKGVVQVPAAVEVRFKGASNLTDAMLDAVAGISPGAIQSLVLGDTEVTDAGLQKCHHLQGVTDIALYNAHVGDTGVLQLASMPSIKHLNLSGTKVTDAIAEGLLAKLPVLESLNLQGTAITATVLPFIVAHKELSLLFLPDSCATDEALRSLSGLQALSWLSLSGKTLTEASVDTLIGFANLRQLMLPGLRLSDEATARIRRGLPNCDLLY